MTLQVSGAISASQIRTELGGTGAVSLNATASRALAEKTTNSTIIKYSDFYGKSNLKPYSSWSWFYGVLAQDTGPAIYPFEAFVHGAKATKDGGIFIAGQYGQFGLNSKPWYGKFNSAGTVVFNKMLNEGGSFSRGASASFGSGLDRGCIGEDSAGNFYLTMTRGGTANQLFQVFKINGSTGSVMWRKYLGDNGLGGGLQHVFVNSSDEIIVTNIVYDSSNNQLLALTKLDSNGNVIWQKRNNTVAFSCSGGGFDSAGNLYITLFPSGRFVAQLLKVNSSGDIVWVNNYNHTIAMDGLATPYRGLWARDVRVSKSGRVYLLVAHAGYETSSAAYVSYGAVLEINPANGNILNSTIARTLGVGQNDYMMSMTIDDANNIYVLGNDPSTDNVGYRTLSRQSIFKFDSSLNCLWWRRVLDNSNPNGTALGGYASGFTTINNAFPNAGSICYAGKAFAVSAASSASPRYEGLGIFQLPGNGDWVQSMTFSTLYTGGQLTYRSGDYSTIKNTTQSYTVTPFSMTLSNYPTTSGFMTTPTPLDQVAGAGSGVQFRSQPS